MDIIIREGKKADIPAVLQLIKELAFFEKAPEEVTNTEEDMIRDGFGDHPVFKLLIAEHNSSVVGIAVYFVKYSTWKGKGVYLDDIIITDEYRRKGIGTLLFNALVEECRKNNAKQLHWQVLDWNENAISFYKKYDAEFDSEWLNCKLNQNQILNFKGENESI